MEIYIVICGIQYEYEKINSVWTSKKMAENRADQLKTNYWDYVRIETHILKEE
ncbi:MAG: hypothetical protein GY870_04675 [archaeon]|nr:hypothetical protein [archaeon]